MTTVACSEFVKRQIPSSGYSHFSGTWLELASITRSYMSVPDRVKPGYRDGVILVSVPATANTPFGGWTFYSATVTVNEKTKLVSNYAPRVPGEDPYIRAAAKCKKQAASHVEIVCYRTDVLAEDNARSTDADWEIICIKARASDEEEPMHYYTMARNHLHMRGGTQGNFSADDFAKSIIYWNSHAMCTSQISWIKRLFNFCAAIFQ